VRWAVHCALESEGAMQIPIVTEELAGRLERAEAEFWVSRLDSVRRYADNPLGVEIRQFGEATAFLVQALPQPVLNLAGALYLPAAVVALVMLPGARPAQRTLGYEC
jgi:hypothetical protein